MFMPSRLKAAALAASLAVACATGPALAKDNTDQLEADATASLSKLYETTPKAKELAEHAKGVLIFPEIVKAGLIAGGQYGKGVLREGQKSVGYYSSAAGSIGFQAGAQKFGYALVLMTDKAVNQINAADGWDIGTGPSIVDKGAGASLTAKTAKADVYAFVFDQKGLMGGIALEGTKITKLDRP